ncbi:MAG: hypothetical protein JNM81_18185 [Rhodospirillaceae bacterium]|nr:hypothetical protein [Rhodospirillaceae bacterium]
MSDIPTAGNIALVNADARSQGGGTGRDRSPPPNKVANAYQEIAKNKPFDDRITILGIPAEQITPATQAALASLVAEVNFLRSSVRRFEGGQVLAKRDTQPAESEVLPADVLSIQLLKFLSQPAEAGHARVLVLAYLSTFEDVRRSSGLLAANSLLSDLSQRMNGVEFFADPSLEIPEDTSPPQMVPVKGKNGKIKMLPVEKPPRPGLYKFRMMGFAGGSSLVGVVELPAAPLDETYIARQVRDHCLAQSFNVSGIDMAVALSVAAIVISANEGALTAMGRADHLLRGSNF